MRQRELSVVWGDLQKTTWKKKYKFSKMLTCLKKINIPEWNDFTDWCHREESLDRFD